jgi:tRNA (mo5U34)-methyltransferase
MDIIEKIKTIPYWYHRIELPNNIVTPGWSPICADKYAIPEDLTGKRVLDIGAWDGYWTWEALSRGAKEVVAIDDFSDDLGSIDRQGNWDSFDICREAFGFEQKAGRWRNKQKQVVRRLEMSIYDVEELGRFDIVFFFGTIYHLKHPLLALEKISAICDGELYIESAICDDYSPYRGGLDGGYRNSDMVAEFYPGDEFGENKGNWWNPTLKCLGYMLQASGFPTVELWRLTENPNSVMQCRGFAFAGKSESVPESVRKQAYTDKVVQRKAKVAAVMSVPRLGFQDNWLSIFETLVPLKIPMLKVQGVFWGQCLERGLMIKMDEGADFLLTIDYDTVFKKEDLQELIVLMEEHPEVDALVPLQSRRGNRGALATVRTESGRLMPDVKRDYFEGDLSKIATGHFGLTLFRADALKKLPHPWFLPEPGKDGLWEKDRVDEDIYFWHKFRKCGFNAYMANRVVIGHLELMVTWPDRNMQPFQQLTKDFYTEGKPDKAWK